MSRTRITAGEYRGRQIATPPGHGTRPTTSRVREALFNIVGPEIIGATVVDLYAGAGTVGFEALSRGAARVTFVEADRCAIDVITATGVTLGCAPRCRIVRADVTRWVAGAGDDIAAAGICFVDAPYRDDAAGAVLAAVCARPPRLVVCEHHRARALPDEIGMMRRTREARYGLTHLSFYRPGAGHPEPGDQPA